MELRIVLMPFKIKTITSNIAAKFKLLIIFLVALLLLECAMQALPSGGPPDKTPPEILSVYPIADSIHVGIYLKKIQITFSERMSEGTLPNSLFISPILNYELKWSGTTKLTIQVNDTLKKEQTYVVTIGSGAQDAHKNKLKQSFQFAFSTGSIIDHGSISGIVYELKSKEAVNLFAYTLSDTASMDLNVRKPDYISQSGMAGHFKFNYLKQGAYRIFAVQDQNNNLLIDRDFEKIGIPFRDVVIDSFLQSFEGLNFLLSKSDTIRPYLISAKALNEHYIRIRLNKPVITPAIDQIMVLDSINNSYIKLLGASKSREESFFVELYTDSINEDSFYKVRVLSMADSIGNTTSDQETRIFPGSAKADTVSPALLMFMPEDSTLDVHPISKIRMEFSRPMDWLMVQKSFNLQISSGKNIQGEWNIKNSYEAEFIPKNELIPDSFYVASISLDSIKDLWGATFGDSLLIHNFKIISLKQLGEISGNVSINQQVSPVFINFKALKRKKSIYHLYIPAPGKFYKPYLPGGKYLADSFLDVDENGRYSYGKLSPFTYAEPFLFLEDTISVRSRWETSDVNIEIPYGQRSHE